MFSADDTVFADPAGAPIDYGFDAAALRQSIGLVARFQIPFGTLSVSYALPLDERRRPMSPDTHDDIERLQLTVRAEF